MRFATLLMINDIGNDVFDIDTRQSIFFVKRKGFPPDDVEDVKFV